jgi:hypothetical protein
VVDVQDYRVPDKAPEPPPEPEKKKEEPPFLLLDDFAERVILGAILLESDLYPKVAERLEADDFGLDSHRRIFLRMGELQEEGTTIDLVTLIPELTKHRELETIGGVSYLASLTEGLPQRPQVRDYIKIVKDRSLRRYLYSACEAATARIESPRENAILIADSLRDVFTKASAEAVWMKPEQLLVSAIDFSSQSQKEVDWIVHGIIQRGGNGIIAADGKTGKSLLAIHLALHLATGSDWLGLGVMRQIQTALISREDDPGETARRIGSFVRGAYHNLRYPGTLEDWFWLSTRAQMPTFMLENKKEVREIIEALKFRKVEVAFFDVFRSLWTGDENDAEEVSKVLETLRMIQREVGCSVVLLHHLNKGDSPNPFQKLRGSTAISGWWEWGLGINITNQEDDESQWVRQIRFQTKAAQAHSRMFYRICGFESEMKIEVVHPEEKAAATTKTRRKVGDIVKSPTEQPKLGWKDDG